MDLKVVGLDVLFDVCCKKFGSKFENLRIEVVDGIKMQHGRVGVICVGCKRDFIYLDSDITFKDLPSVVAEQFVDYISVLEDLKDCDVLVEDCDVETSNEDVGIDEDYAENKKRLVSEILEEFEKRGVISDPTLGLEECMEEDEQEEEDCIPEDCIPEGSKFINVQRCTEGYECITKDCVCGCSEDCDNGSGDKFNITVDVTEDDGVTYEDEPLVNGEVFHEYDPSTSHVVIPETTTSIEDEDCDNGSTEDKDE